eukprot:gene8592-biopygen6050
MNMSGRCVHCRGVHSTVPAEVVNTYDEYTMPPPGPAVAGGGGAAPPPLLLQATRSPRRSARRPPSPQGSWF